MLMVPSNKNIPKGTHGRPQFSHCPSDMENADAANGYVFNGVRPNVITILWVVGDGVSYGAHLERSQRAPDRGFYRRHVFLFQGSQSLLAFLKFSYFGCAIGWEDSFSSMFSPFSLIINKNKSLLNPITVGSLKLLKAI